MRPDEKIKLLIVEDDQKLAELIREYLEVYEFSVELLHSGIGAVDSILTRQPDVVILDMMLPGVDGLSICRQVRSRFAGLILILTAIEDDLDQVAAIELDVDDYLVKPVALRLLLARLRMLLRRSSSNTAVSEAPNKLVFGQLTIHRNSREAFYGARALGLNNSEFELFWLLAVHAEKVMSRDLLLRELRGLEYDGTDRSIDARIVGLRKKVCDNTRRPFRIITVRGQGYLFVSDAWG